MSCYVLCYNFLLHLYSFCRLNKVISSNMFEFIFNPLYGLARQLRYECHWKHLEVRFLNIYILPIYVHTLILFMIFYH